MGAWDTGVFDNDSALEAIQDAMDDTLPVWLDDAEENYREFGMLDAEYGAGALAISALVLGHPIDYFEDEELDQVEALIDSATTEDRARLKELVRITLSSEEQSELYELTQERDEEEVAEWKRQGHEILEAL